MFFITFWFRILYIYLEELLGNPCREEACTRHVTYVPDQDKFLRLFCPFIKRLILYFLDSPKDYFSNFSKKKKRKNEIKDIFERFFFAVEEVKAPVPTQLLTVLCNHLKPTLQQIPQHIKKAPSGTQRN